MQSNSKCKTMTKAELINEISIQTGYDKTTIGNVLESFMTQVKKAASNEEDVFMRGFGTFTTKVRAAKKARIIAKNMTIDVPAHKIPYFKPSPEYQETVR